MSDIVTYITTFVAELAGALPPMVYSPVAYGALVGGALIGAFSIGASARRNWVLAGCTFLLIFAVMAIESDFFRSQVPPRDRAALALIYVIGALAGYWLGWFLRRSSAQHP